MSQCVTNKKEKVALGLTTKRPTGQGRDPEKQSDPSDDNTAEDILSIHSVFTLKVWRVAEERASASKFPSD